MKFSWRIGKMRIANYEDRSIIDGPGILFIRFGWKWQLSIGCGWAHWGLSDRA